MGDRIRTQWAIRIKSGNYWTDPKVPRHRVIALAGLVDGVAVKVEIREMATTKRKAKK